MLALVKGSPLRGSISSLGLLHYAVSFLRRTLLVLSIFSIQWWTGLHVNIVPVLVVDVTSPTASAIEDI